MSRLAYTALLVVALSATFGVHAAAQIYTLPRVDPANGDYFGGSVAIDGDRILVGATGISTCGENSGAAYVYEREPESGRWLLEATLTPDDCQVGLFFGRTLDLSGNTAVVAAFRNAFSTAGSNAAYVFERDTTGTWRQVVRLTGVPDQTEGPFAADVSMDGDRILVTTSGDLADGRFGGAAYVFERQRQGWVRAARLTASADTRSGIMGGSGQLDGNRFVVSASRYFRGGRGSVYVFEFNEDEKRWHESARLDGFEDFFISSGIDGDRIIVGESKAGRNSDGRATVYRFDSDWVKEAVLRPTHPFSLGAFGSDVVIEGDRALVVGYDEQLEFSFNIDRVVYAFEAEPAWTQRHVIDVGSVYFGSSLDLDQGVAVIGQVSEDEPGTVIVVQLH